MSAKRRQLLLLIVGGALAVAAAVVAIVLLTGGGVDERAALADAGCTLQSFQALPNKPDHSEVPAVATKPKWNSMPPTSGPHYGIPAVWGSYDEQVPLTQSLHNLEHGGVVIHYGPKVPQAQVNAIRDWYQNQSDPNGLIISPLSTNKAKITLSAWTAPDSATGTNDRGRGWLARCSKFDEDAFSAFIDAHRYKGPERLPRESLVPGT